MPRIITPAPYPVPAGIVTYTDESDWRKRNVAGPIPRDPNSMSRFWSDPSAINNTPVTIPGFPQIFRETEVSPEKLSYLIPARNFSNDYQRCKIGSPAFYNSYSPTLAHNGMVQTMKQYAWVYELTGDPVLLNTVFLSPKEAATPNFSNTNPNEPNYPINLRSDFMFFTLNKVLLCLPTADFIEYFKPQGNASLADKRATVLGLAQDTRLSDAAAISMIRLTIQDTPNPVLI